MWYVIREDELYHHGILGQKWGVRRFQNPDGSLTSAGRKRYGVEGEDGTGAQKKKIDGKKIAVAAGVTVAAAVGVGLAVKYRKEIGAAVGKLAHEKLPDMAAKGKNLGANVSDQVNRKASSTLTKAGMIGREFAKNQKGKLVEAANKAISEGSNELTKAAVVAVAGIGAKKLSEAKERNDQSESKSKVADILLSSGNKGIDSFISSVKNSSGNNNSNNNSNNGKAGATVGKEVTDKLGKPANRGQYTTDEMTRYNNLHNRLRDNKEQKAIIKSLKSQGYSIEQLERYADSI